MKNFVALSIFIVLAISVQAIPGNANVDAGDEVALSKSDRLPLYDIVRDCSQQVWPSADGSACKRACRFNGDHFRS
jgi:hypothetical protein